MKKIFFLTLLVISISGIAASQVITFDKTLYSTGDSYSNIATQVIQDYDGGYILNCYHNLKFIKTDQYGYIEWIKEYPEITNPGYEIRRTFDGGFIAIGSKLNNGESDACLIKLDNNLDTIWTRTYGKADSSEQGASVIQLPDSTFLFSFYTNYGVTLHKVDMNGNVLLSKNLSGGGSFVYRMYLQNLNDGNFLFWKASELYKMDVNLNIIWTSIGSSSFAKSTSDNSILTGSRTNFKKLDINGNLIWEKDISYCRSMIELSNGNYLLLIDESYGVARPCKILQTDTSGNILSQTLFEFTGHNFTNTQDGGFVICGNIKYDYYYPYTISFFAPRIIKTDQVCRCGRQPGCHETRTDLDPSRLIIQLFC